MFINVVKNAIEAMPAGGRLILKLNSDHKMIHIDIVGHKIITSHKGMMDITSELGKGTTVHITLPAVK